MGKLIQYCTNASLFDGEWKWQAAGMGYIIETDYRHYIVVDGGLERIDAENLISMLTELSGNHPTVDLWIITHPHLDHYGALKFIINEKELCEKIKIKKICKSFPDEFSWGGGKTLSDIKIISEMCASLDNCEIITPECDDEINIDGTVIRFFFTYKDASILSDPNELSLVFSVKGSKKSVMFTGDAYENGLLVVYRKHRDDLSPLKCDYIQLAHHGLNGGYTYFYKAVGASVALVPISVSGDKAMRVPEELRGHHNLYAQSLASSVIKAFTGTITLEL